MRIAVMGAGAVGGYFGGVLANQGEDVVLATDRVAQEVPYGIFRPGGDPRIRIDTVDRIAVARHEVSQGDFIFYWIH